MFDIFVAVDHIRKSFHKRDVIIILALVGLYLITRVINLEGHPIFSDEGIYIHWAKVAWHDANWRFISLTDGKQPLQTWGTIPFLKLFSSYPLLAGRLFAVATGFFGLTGIFSLLYYLFGKKAAYWGSFFYIFTPYFLFYDRLALVDSGVNAFFIWILFFAILLAKNMSLGEALLFGLMSGFGLLAKSSVRMFIGLSILGPLLFTTKSRKHFIKQAINFLFLYGTGATLALLIYNVQRLSPFFHFVEEKNKTFVMTSEEFLAAPFSVFKVNAYQAPFYILWESGFVLPILAILGMYILYRHQRKLFYYLLIWFIAPYIVVAFLSKVLYPRYIIFMAGLLLVPAGYFMSRVKNRATIAIIIIPYLISSIYFGYPILFNFSAIPFPPVDRGQYIEGWPAGWGIREIIEYAREKATAKPVILIAEGTFGMSGDALDSHLTPEDKITIRGYWPLDEKELRENQKDLETHSIFIVFSHRHDFPANWPIRFIEKFDKPGNQSSIYLFELTK